MPMNAVIRIKRKEIGLTQEQVAEALGVSAPAVNKWESGTTYPDITLLPALARLLKVDLNTLLCFEESLSDEEISHFTVKVEETMRTAGFESGYAMVMEKVREYPNCFPLIYSSAQYLDVWLKTSGLSSEEQERYDGQITALYERAAKSGDEQVRNNSISMLASKYMSRGENVKAREMIDLLPERSTIDKRMLQVDLLMKQGKLAEAAEALERRLLQTQIYEIQSILLILSGLALRESDAQAASRLSEIAGASARLFGLWDFYAYLGPFQTAVGRKDVRDSVSSLRSLLEAAHTPWDIKKTLLYRHLTADENSENANAYMLPAMILQLDHNPLYAFLREDGEYRQLLEQYRAKG